MSSTRRRPTAPTAPAEVWTPAMVRALGVTTDLRTAAAIFGVSASAAYDAARQGTFPVPLLRAGGVYRVPVAAILIALRLPPIDTAAPIEDTSTSAHRGSPPAAG
jgi:hypothetical protein